MAEWLGRGLQNLVQQFESARDLNRSRSFLSGIFILKPRKRIFASGNKIKRPHCAAVTGYVDRPTTTDHRTAAGGEVICANQFASGYKIKRPHCAAVTGTEKTNLQAIKKRDAHMNTPLISIDFLSAYHFTSFLSILNNSLFISKTYIPLCKLVISIV